jgi:tRNA-uridine 2-sulfurtransferase
MDKKKVLVAMSGGVDSSVSAALLKKAGFDVSGVFMRFWKERGVVSEGEKLAKLSAEKIGIPFYILDLKKEFKNKVVNYFLKELKLGLTPNPCVFCNKEMKFKFLFDFALKIKADFIATGHYAKIVKRGNAFKIFEAKDKDKDQSYFLWRLGQKELSRLIFPMASLIKKTEVRKIAKDLKLPSAVADESQEICFITSDISGFLKRNIKGKPGKIRNKQGEEIGQHNGLWFYTIGQRKGISISGKEPYYVLSKDFKKNELIVGTAKDLFTKSISIKDSNWISGKKPKSNLKIKARIRYRQKAFPIILRNNKAIFIKQQTAPAPGQSIVFYRGQELLGGGIMGA